MRTSASLEALLDGFFFDWFAFTLPHPVTGKGGGCKRGSVLEWHAASSLISFALESGLHISGDQVKGGINGYGGAAHLTADAFSREKVATVLSGHSTNMPGMFFSGGNGICTGLVAAAKRSFRRMLVGRADAAQYYSSPILFEALLELAHSMSIEKT